MPLSLSTAAAAQSMPKGKGYGSKAGAKKKGAKKELPAFLQKKGAAKPATKAPAKGKKAPAKGAKKEMPAFLKKKSKKK